MRRVPAVLSIVLLASLAPAVACRGVTDRFPPPAASSALSFGDEAVPMTDQAVPGCGIAFCVKGLGCHLCAGVDTGCGPQAGCLSPGYVQMGPGQICSPDGCLASACQPAFCDPAAGVCRVCDDGDPGTDDLCVDDPASPCVHVPIPGGGQPPPPEPLPGGEASAELSSDVPVAPEPDARVTPEPDAAVGPQPDASVAPEPDAPVTPEPDAPPGAGSDPGAAGAPGAQPPRDGLCAFTQGGWGQRCRGQNVGCLRDAHFAEVYPDGLEVGGEGAPFAILLTSAAAVEAFLPQGSNPGSLTGSLVDPLSSPAGVLAGQATALHLNIDFDDAGLSAGAKGGLLAHEVIAEGPLAGMTVRELLILGERALGGATGVLPPGVSLSDVSDAMAEVNESHHACDPGAPQPRR